MASVSMAESSRAGSVKSLLPVATSHADSYNAQRAHDHPQNSVALPFIARISALEDSARYYHLMVTAPSGRRELDRLILGSLFSFVDRVRLKEVRDAKIGGI